MLRVGLVVDNTIKQKALAQLVTQAGHSVGVSLVLGGTKLTETITELNTQAELDVWWIDIADQNHDQEEAAVSPNAKNTTKDINRNHREEGFLERLFSQSQVPVILNDSSECNAGTNDHNAWSRRTSMRLQRLSSDINLQQATPAGELWLLAASTGGPAAVKRFFAELPANLGIAFLYVQHIDEQQTVTLNRMMTNAGNYPAMVATQGRVLTANSLTVITARESVEVLANGTLMLNGGQQWKGSYAPSVDQVAANAARIYRERCNLIVFTGMGDDGAASCRLIKQLGGKVWVQSPSDCTSDSMPVSALATGCVSLMGTPEYLAKALIQICQPHLIANDH